MLIATDPSPSNGVDFYEKAVNRNTLYHRVHTNTCFYKGERTDIGHFDFFGLMALVFAHELYAAIFFRSVDIFYGNVLITAKVYAKQVHFAPEDAVSNIFYLFVHYDVAALQ